LRIRQQSALPPDFRMTRGAPPNAALARTRRLAGGVLTALVAIFLGTHLLSEPTGAVLLVRAMAEAGMIGGLADWFAVEALFRHPLGLPIPHTALLPRNQARAARNVGRFFEEHFLEPDRLRARLIEIEPSRHLAGWMERPENALTLARQLTGIVGAVAAHDPSPRMLVQARAWLRRQVLAAQGDAAMAENLGVLIKQAVRGEMVGEVLKLVRRSVDENRDKAAEMVEDRSRWWIASRVDRGIAEVVVNGVLSLLEDLGREQGGLRRDFEGAFDAMIDRLVAEGVLERAVGQARAELVRSGVFDDLVMQVATGLRDRLTERLDENPEALAVPIGQALRHLAATALTEPASRAAFDTRLADLAAQIIGDMRPAISAYVTDVIAGWSPDELNERFEAEIGPDLQYIRINGAVLGALIGGVIFAFDTLAS
jgi:uncharacterized membrane-anchored protein YjiN (DUF445 family)